MFNQLYAIANSTFYLIENVGENVSLLNSTELKVLGAFSVIIGTILYGKELKSRVINYLYPPQSSLLNDLAAIGNGELLDHVCEFLELRDMSRLNQVSQVVHSYCKEKISLKIYLYLIEKFKEMSIGAWWRSQVFNLIALDVVKILFKYNHDLVNKFFKIEECRFYYVKCLVKKNQNDICSSLETFRELLNREKFSDCEQFSLFVYAAQKGHFSYQEIESFLPNFKFLYSLHCVYGLQEPSRSLKELAIGLHKEKNHKKGKELALKFLTMSFSGDEEYAKCMLFMELARRIYDSNLEITKEYYSLALQFLQNHNTKREELISSIICQSFQLMGEKTANKKLKEFLEDLRISKDLNFIEKVIDEIILYHFPLSEENYDSILQILKDDINDRSQSIMLKAYSKIKLLIKVAPRIHPEKTQDYFNQAYALILEKLGYGDKTRLVMLMEMIVEIANSIYLQDMEKARSLIKEAIIYTSLEKSDREKSELGLTSIFSKTNNNILKTCLYEVYNLLLKSEFMQQNLKLYIILKMIDCSDNERIKEMFRKELDQLKPESHGK